MKKTISVLLSAAMGINMLSGLTSSVCAEEQTNRNFVIFGDSIAAGYGLDEDEYNYGEICADYYGSEVENYAVSGDDTEDLLEVLSGLDAAQKKKVSDAGVIVISIGGNDMLGYASKYLINYAAKKGFLNEGYTITDIPENPSVSDLSKYVNILGAEGLMNYAASNANAALELGSELKILCANLRLSSDKYEGVILNKTIPNIKKAAAQLRELNPDARIIVQTVYQPFQLEKSFIDAEFGNKATLVNTIVGQLRMNLRQVMDTFKTELMNIEGIEIADVYYEFTSLADGVSQNANNPGNAHYFVNVQTVDRNEADIHPNQKGHLAIASEIITTLGDVHDDKGLLSDIYKKLSDKYDYPHIALDTYKTAAGNIMIGDVNFDEKIDARDAALVLSEYAGISTGADTSLSEIQASCADVDNDGKVMAADAARILEYYAYVSAGNNVSLEDFLAK